MRRALLISMRKWLITKLVSRVTNFDSINKKRGATVGANLLEKEKCNERIRVKIWL